LEKVHFFLQDEMRRIALAALVTLMVACERSATPESGGDASAMGGMMHDMTATVDTTGLRELAVPAELAAGRERFDASCATCHGEFALGTDVGPPLVHIIYEPNHHGDGAFILAAEQGVRAHHWSFGDMAPVQNVSREDLLEIVRYVRWLQQEAGIR
jgi:mono/diheme cytochrome c family protein